MTNNVFEVKFQGPKLVAVSEVMERVDKVEELMLTLNYPIFGDVMVKVWKEGSQYKYYDREAPIQTRTFDSIESMVWEYELPKSVIPYLDKL